MEKSEAPDNLEELHRITDILLDKSLRDSPEALESLASLFDLLLWAEKRSEDTLTNIVECKLLVILLEKYKSYVSQLVSGYILLLGNAKDEGILIQHVLQHQLPDQVLRLYLDYLAKAEDIDEEEHLHTLGSYLKAYHRHLTEKSMKWIIKDGNCLLLSLCCQFFNCPEEITRTSIMNILMTVLKLPIAHELLSYPQIRSDIRRWSLNMCRLLRNELKDFDQNLLTTEESESQYIIHLINDKVCLWQDLSALSEHLFAEAFYEEIMIPLVIGSLNTNGIPLFTLKFSLFILNKLIKTFRNLDLLSEFGQLLFVSQTVSYKDCQMGTAVLRQFGLRKLGIAQSEVEEDSELNEFSQVNQLFLNILRTKDSRFLQCVCTLLLNLFSQARKSPKCAMYFCKELGFGVNGFNTILVSEILINQFNALHSMEINRLVCYLLVQLQPSKQLPEDARYRFSHLYRKHIQQALRNIERQREHYDYICEIFEYDVRVIYSPAFGFGREGLELKTDAALIFNNQIIENELQPFYKQIPETDRHMLRYGLVKTLLLRRLAMAIIEQCAGQRSLERYLQRLRAEQARFIRPGEYLKLPLACNSYRCKLVDQKIQIPNCLLLEDDGNLIIGYLDNVQVKVIINIKMKHITPHFKTKKEKVFSQIDIRKYDHNGSQDLTSMKGVILKNLEVGIEYFKIKKRRIFEKEAATIGEILKHAKECIPAVSLI